MRLTRTLTPYERTQLARHGVDFGDDDAFVATYGEMPVEYVTGHVDFCELDFLVTPDTLIPRLETEELVKMVVDEATTRAHSSNARVAIADIGTGCGAIAISATTALARRDIGVDVVASEISAQALEVAKQNATRLLSHEAQQCVRLLLSDLLASYRASDQFDIMVANLPYIPHERINSLEPSVKDHEPWLALDGGADGLAHVRAFLTQAPKHLKKGGIILLEIDYTHDQDAWREFAASWQVELVEDQFTRTRFAKIRARV